MSDERDLDALLDPFFAAARRTAPEARPDFLAAVLAQADAALVRPAPVRRQGRAWRILSALGGWGTIGGMATAAAFGLWIGFVGSNDFKVRSAWCRSCSTVRLSDGPIVAMASQSASENDPCLSRYATILSIVTLTYVVGAWLLMHGLTTIGEIVTFMGFATMLVGRLEQIVAFVNFIFMQAPKMREFFEVVDTLPAVRDLPGAPAT